MKATVMAAAALLGGASAHNHQRHAHAHAPYLKRGQNDAGLVCTETVETITGDFICMSSSPPARSHPWSSVPGRGLLADTKDSPWQGFPLLTHRRPTRQPRRPTRPPPPPRPRFLPLRFRRAPRPVCILLLPYLGDLYRDSILTCAPRHLYLPGHDRDRERDHYRCRPLDNCLHSWRLHARRRDYVRLP